MQVANGRAKTCLCIAMMVSTQGTTRLAWTEERHRILGRRGTGTVLRYATRWKTARGPDGPRGTMRQCKKGGSTEGLTLVHQYR
jgi:hypothetical protein